MGSPLSLSKKLQKNIVPNVHLHLGLIYFVSFYKYDIPNYLLVCVLGT